MRRAARPTLPKIECALEDGRLPGSLGRSNNCSVLDQLNSAEVFFGDNHSTRTRTGSTHFRRRYGTETPNPDVRQKYASE
jgi:hypothetical protein